MARLQEGTEEENQQRSGTKRKDCASDITNTKDSAPLVSTKRTQYGAAIPVKTTGNFPQAGSILGPYFCLGTLGKGTFSSIHKCINLDFGHRNSNKCRLAAAKVELSTFANSGVLLGEALVLHFLDESLPRGTVPVYMGHYTAGESAAALVMEYLPGDDMHQLRENRSAQSPTGRAPRRLTTEDAVYLTADVMLPLLEQMHRVGIVHRDVKPSNCVRSKGRQFCMVDFGLSKSVVVPMDSAYADSEHPWPVGQPWLTQPNDSSSNAPKPIQPGCYRKERTSADFRGTSMYASPRVHQGRDYCPRDDCWSLLYVFCDLVSGGLPWMSHAANRDRDMCQKIKERVHGLTPTGSNPSQDETERLLMGDDFHVALFRHQRADGSAPTAVMPALDSLPADFPKPLDMFQDKTKIKLLREAFAHLAKLQFWDTPDYQLLRRCIHGFVDEEGAILESDEIDIQWTDDCAAKDTPKKKKKRKDKDEREMPKWEFRGLNCDRDLDEDPLVDAELFEDIEVPPPESLQGTNGANLSEWEKAVRRLPLELQFRVAQMQYHVEHRETAIPHIVLNDWMKVAIPLLYKDWDSKAYESGGHRTQTDGYRREFYLDLIEKCLKWSKIFDNFSKKEYLGYHTSQANGIKDRNGDGQAPRKRQINTKNFAVKGSLPHDLAAVSKILFGLKQAQRAEKEKSFAPPPLLSFGSTR